MTMLLYMATDFTRMIDEHSNDEPIDISVMFASDGFHPSSLMYGYWAEKMAELIAQLLNPHTTTLKTKKSFTKQYTLSHIFRVENTL